MNIKSLLLGCGAALATVSGAQAADAIVAAEAAPIEYVRVCDAFGTGYFYIPGTETCLKLGGRVRYDMQIADSYTAHSDDGWNKLTRAELWMDTASDSEYGALKTKMILRWNWTTDGYFTGPSDDIFLGNTQAQLIWATISIAGFEIGVGDSQFASYLGYAGNVINDDVIQYGPEQQEERAQISYTYDPGNGFSAVFAVENSGNNDPDSPTYRASTKYMPDLVAGAGYSAGSWSFKVVGGYDSVAEEGAIKARVDGTFGGFTAFFMGGWNTDGSTTNVYAAGSNTYGVGWGDWAFWTGFTAPITEKLEADLQVAADDNNTLAIAANLRWMPLPGALIQPEVTYTKWDNDVVDSDQWNAMLRFQRDF